MNLTHNINLKKLFVHHQYLQVALRMTIAFIASATIASLNSVRERGSDSVFDIVPPVPPVPLRRFHLASDFQKCQACLDQNQTGDHRIGRRCVNDALSGSYIY